MDFDYKANMLSRIMCSTSFFSLLFGIMHSLNINNIGTFHATVNYISSVLLILLAYLLKQKNTHFKPVLFAFLGLCFAICLSTLINISTNQFRSIWFFILIMLAFFFGGKSTGYPLAIISSLTIILSNVLIKDTFNDVSLTGMIIAIIIFSMFLATFTDQMSSYILLLDKQRNELNYLANKDPLTGVLNSKVYEQLGKKQLLYAKENGENLSILYADIDHFRQVNKRYGQQLGDLFLQHVVDVMKSVLHSNGIIVHIGGEEFCIILPGTDLINARNLALRVKNAVRDRYYHHKEEVVVVTMSIGVASLHESDQEIRSIQIRADKALIKAKHLGGDEVITYEYEYE